MFADAAGDIQKLEQERFTAYVKGDTAALERIFADDLVDIPFDACPIASRSTAELRLGRAKISRFDAEDIQVRQIGDMMVATGLVHVDLT